MSSKFGSLYRKDEAFVEFFFKVHPEYKDMPEQDQSLIRKLASMGHLNTEMIMEGLLPLLQPDLIRTDVKGMDYFCDPESKHFHILDESDMKTSSIFYGTNGCFNGSIGGVNTKLGTLLVAVYNFWKDDIDFFQIPHDAYSGKGSDISVSGKQIYFTWNRTHDRYSNNLEFYRVSFEEMICIND